MSVSTRAGVDRYVGGTAGNVLGDIAPVVSPGRAPVAGTAGGGGVVGGCTVTGGSPGAAGIG